MTFEYFGSRFLLLAGKGIYCQARPANAAPTNVPWLPFAQSLAHQRVTMMFCNPISATAGNNGGRSIDCHARHPQRHHDHVPIVDQKHDVKSALLKTRA